MYMLNMVIILIVMYCNVVTAIDKIPTYLLRFNKEYRCAITKIFDSAQAEKLLQEERIGEIPKRVGQHAMEATHIIPFLLNGLYGRAITDLQIVRNVLSFSHFTHLCNRRTLLRLWICFGPGREST